MPLTPVAIAAGQAPVRIVSSAAQTGAALDYDNIPTVIFGHPPIGTVGSEAEARERHGTAVQRLHLELRAALPRHDVRKPHTHMKLVTVGTTERIVGAHVIGPGADEMLQGFAVAVRMGARKRDFDDTVAIHPTSAEEFVTMR